MRKVLLVLLVVAAVPLYVWDTYLLLIAAGVVQPSAESVSGHALSRPALQVAVLRQRARYVKKGRSPFLAHAPQARAASMVSVARPRSPKPASAPRDTTKAPPVRVTGIMWNATNPVAMIESGGESVVAKPGDVLAGGVQVRSIERTAVKVRFRGKDFVLTQ